MNASKRQVILAGKLALWGKRLIRAHDSDLVGSNWSVLSYPQQTMFFRLPVFFDRTG